MAFEVINTEAFAGDAETYLQSAGCQTRHVSLKPLSEEEKCRQLQGVHAVIADGETYTPRMFEAADQLKIIARVGVGVDCVDLQCASQHGVWVTNTPGATNNSVAEFAIGMTLNLLRQMHTLAADSKSGTFVRKGGPELGSLTVGAVGAGGIGKQFLRIARGFGAKCLAHDVNPDPQFADQWEVEYVSLEELLQRADVVSVHCGLNDSTRDMIGTTELELMKPTSLLINTGRPRIVNEAALYEHLKAGKIAGAGIDVWDPFPPNPDDPLLTLDNVLATPWSAFFSEQAVCNMWQRAAREVVRVKRGERPIDPVNEPVA